jgi:hypothetical protein
VIMTLGPKMASSGVVMSFPSVYSSSSVRAPQIINDVIGDVAAAVVAFVDDRGLLVNLREVIAG